MAAGCDGWTDRPAGAFAIAKTGHLRSMLLCWRREI